MDHYERDLYTSMKLKVLNPTLYFIERLTNSNIMVLMWLERLIFILFLFTACFLFSSCLSVFYISSYWGLKRSFALEEQSELYCLVFSSRGWCCSSDSGVQGVGDHLSIQLWSSMSVYTEPGDQVHEYDCILDQCRQMSWTVIKPPAEDQVTPWAQNEDSEQWSALKWQNVSCVSQKMPHYWVVFILFLLHDYLYYSILFFMIKKISYWNSETLQWIMWIQFTNRRWRTLNYNTRVYMCVCDI